MPDTRLRAVKLIFVPAARAVVGTEQVVHLECPVVGVGFEVGLGIRPVYVRACGKRRRHIGRSLLDDDLGRGSGAGQCQLARAGAELAGTVFWKALKLTDLTDGVMNGRSEAPFCCKV